MRRRPPPRCDTRCSAERRTARPSAGPGRRGPPRSRISAAPPEADEGCAPPRGAYAGWKVHPWSNASGATAWGCALPRGAAGPPPGLLSREGGGVGLRAAEWWVVSRPVDFAAALARAAADAGSVARMRTAAADAARDVLWAHPASRVADHALRLTAACAAADALPGGGGEGAGAGWMESGFVPAPPSDPAAHNTAPWPGGARPVAKDAPRIRAARRHAAATAATASPAARERSAMPVP